jgi:hypothetical protein
MHHCTKGHNGLVSTRHPMLVYSAFRLLLFAVPFAVLMVAGVDFVWSVLIAAIGSAIASIFILARYRDELSESISTRSERMRARSAEREQSEDAWDDAQRAEDDASGDGNRA